jgi:26S proteasome regulatory subunit N5
MTDSTVVDGGRIVKMEVDYSSNCDTKIPECKKLAQEGKLHDALDQLLVLEKLTRTVSQIFILKYLYITSFHRFVPN